MHLLLLKSSPYTTALYWLMPSPAAVLTSLQRWAYTLSILSKCTSCGHPNTVPPNSMHSIAPTKKIATFRHGDRTKFGFCWQDIFENTQLVMMYKLYMGTNYHRFLKIMQFYITHPNSSIYGLSFLRFGNEMMRNK